MLFALEISEGVEVCKGESILVEAETRNGKEILIFVEMHTISWKSRGASCMGLRLTRAKPFLNDFSLIPNETKINIKVNFE